MRDSRASMLVLAFTIAALHSGAVAAPPDPPANYAPANGATDVPAAPQLCATVTDPAAQPLDVRFFARDLGAAPVADFVIVALPDTQYYSQNHPDIFESQTRWVIENRVARNIVFVSHLGDIVQNCPNDYEWDNADAAMSLLDDPALTGLAEGIPYGLSVGNHDQFPSNRAGYPEDGGTSTTDSFNAHFGVDRYLGRSYYGGHYGTNNDNNYQLFSVDGMDFIFVHHEFDDSFFSMIDEVLPWTDQLLKTYRDRRAILTSHSMLCQGQCPDTLWAEFTPQGQMTYDTLKDNKNLGLMIAAHQGSSLQQPRRSDVWDGHTIHTFLANYQREEDCPFRCGNGWFRILNFHPASDEIQVQTYSAWLGQYRSDPCTDGNSCHDFTLPYEMDGGIPFQVVASRTAVPSGSDVCIPWPGLQPGGAYEWYAESWNGSEWTAGPRWTFDSNGFCTGGSECEDGLACSVDSCQGTTCSRADTPGCCESNADCDDGNYCTDDLCQSGSCSYTDNANACTDGDPCTAGDVCVQGRCLGSAMQCDDGNGCTSDSCLDGACVADYQPVATCCSATTDCDDQNPCTGDSCGSGGVCANLPDPSCCLADSGCDDVDACSHDACTRNRGAFRFDGVDDHAMTGRVGYLGKPVGFELKQFTLECWFRWDGAGEFAKTAGAPYDGYETGVTAYPLVTRGALGNDNHSWRNVNFFLGIQFTGVLAADFEESSSESTPAKNHPVLGSTGIVAGNWYHAAATYDGQCWQLYLDGSPETDGSHCPGVDASDESESIVGLGATFDYNGWLRGRFAGNLDEVRIWSRALSGPEIAANMYAQIEAAPALAGRWALDELDGHEFSDSTGNEHLGIIHGVTVDEHDVAPLSSTGCSHTYPTEVSALGWENYPEFRLTWGFQSGMNYDLLSGTLSDLRSSGTLSGTLCLADDSPASVHVETRTNPPPGDGYYYLTRSVGACEVAGYGTDGAGTERVVSGGCP